jgi:hypothetical protein
VYPETGHAAVRVDRQPDVRVPVGVADVEGILTVPLHFRLLHQGDPGRRGQFIGGRETLEARRLHRDERRVIALEPGRIDHHAVDDAGHAEPDDGVVEAGSTAAPGFPAVVDLPLCPKLWVENTAGSGLIKFSRSANSSSLA